MADTPSCSTFVLHPQSSAETDTVVLCFLSPRELCRVECVSRSWQRCIRRPALWRRLEAVSFWDAEAYRQRSAKFRDEYKDALHEESDMSLGDEVRAVDCRAADRRGCLLVCGRVCVFDLRRQSEVEDEGYDTLPARRKVLEAELQSPFCAPGIKVGAAREEEEGTVKGALELCCV